jgi:hypothetical protein
MAFIKQGKHMLILAFKSRGAYLDQRSAFLHKAAGEWVSWYLIKENGGWKMLALDR